MKRIVLYILLLTLVLGGCDLPLEGFAPAVRVEDGLTVRCLDVGQADSILLQCGSEAMLIDGGNVEDGPDVVARLQEVGVDRLTYVVNTHAHEDHVGGLADVLAAFETDNVWCPVEKYDSQCFEAFAEAAEDQGLALTCPDPGTVWSLGEAEVTVLGPVEDYAETNNTSLVLRVDYGSTSFLFTGDMEREAEAELLDSGADLEADVLKAGHHGSDTSSSYPFLRAVAPSYVLISVGEGNSYGHPGDDALSRFRDADAVVYRTDLQGEIIVASDGASLQFETDRYAAQTNPTEAEKEPGQVTYIGNKKSKIFHLPTCANLPAEKNRITFSDYDAAIAEGYVPCGSCMQ